VVRAPSPGPRALRGRPRHNPCTPAGLRCRPSLQAFAAGLRCRPSLQAFAAGLRCRPSLYLSDKEASAEGSRLALKLFKSRYVPLARTLNWTLGTTPKCYRNGTTPKCWKAIEQQIEGCRPADPVPQAKLAVPVSVPRWCVTEGLKSATPKARAVGDLTNAAFYYLLRVGECTYLGTKQRRRTQQFGVRDVKFWKNGQVLPLNSGATALLAADAATLTLTNQKNGTKGAVIHNDAIHDAHCPIHSLARRVSDILAFTNDIDTPLSAHYDPGHTRQVLSSHINNTAVKSAARALKLHLCDFTAGLVSSHSLRASGAMAMKLNGKDRGTMCKQGRWSSDTFLMHVHEKIAAFLTGISQRRADTFLS
jgi:hypothetical protein